MFEYDETKSAANLAKHGIDFVQAQALWQDDLRAEVRSTGVFVEEPWRVTGQALDRIWTAIVTYRGTLSGSYRFDALVSRRRFCMVVKTISAEEFDRRFDDGEDMSEYMDWSSLRRPGLEAKRVNVDFPTWMVQRLDREAQRRGVTRQSLIKMWLAERLDAAA